MNCKCKAILKVSSPKPAIIVASNVKVVQLMPTDATATSPDVSIGKVFYNNDGRQVGTVDNVLNDMKVVDLVKLNLYGNIELATDEEYLQAKEQYNKLASIILYGGENG